MNQSDTVVLNKAFEQYEYKDTWVNEEKVYDEKPYKILQPQRGVEYKIIKTYGKEDKWLVLKGLTGAYPARFFKLVKN